MQRCMKLLSATVVAAGFAQSAGAGLAQGVTDKEIKIGNTAPYSGPASSYGTIGKANLAYWKMVNA